MPFSLSQIKQMKWNIEGLLPESLRRICLGIAETLVFKFQKREKLPSSFAWVWFAIISVSFLFFQVVCSVVLFFEPSTSFLCMPGLTFGISNVMLLLAYCVKYIKIYTSLIIVYTVIISVSFFQENCSVLILCKSALTFGISNLMLLLALKCMLLFLMLLFIGVTEVWDYKVLHVINIFI